MVHREIKEVKSLTLPEVVERLEHRKQMGPLGYEQQSTYEYAQRFSVVDRDVARQVVEKLVSEFGLTEDVAVDMVNVFPEYKSTVKAIISRDRTLSVDDETIGRILSYLQEVREMYSGEKDKKSSKKGKKKNEE